MFLFLSVTFSKIGLDINCSVFRGPENGYLMSTLLARQSLEMTFFMKNNAYMITQGSKTHECGFAGPIVSQKCPYAFEEVRID